MICSRLFVAAEGCHCFILANFFKFEALMWVCKVCKPANYQITKSRFFEFLRFWEFFEVLRFFNIFWIFEIFKNVFGFWYFFPYFSHFLNLRFFNIFSNFSNPEIFDILIFWQISDFTFRFWYPQIFQVFMRQKLYFQAKIQMNDNTIEIWNRIQLWIYIFVYNSVVLVWFINRLW